MIKKILLTISAVAAVGTAANATLVLYEGFAGYTAGVSLQTQTGGGSGWAADWTGIGGAQPDDTERWQASASSLSNGAFNGTGLSNATGSAFYQTGSNINPNNVAQRVMSTSYTGNTGGVIYFSYLVSGTAWDSNVARFSIQDTSASGRKIEIDNSTNNLQIETSGNPGGGGGNEQVITTSSTVDFAPGGGTYFVVGRVNWTSGVDSPLGAGVPYNTFNGVDTIDVIVYATGDTVGLEPGAGNWTLSAEAYWNNDINFNSIEIISSVVDQYAFDEIRVGTSWADVTAVPEPSTYALMFGFLALGFVMWRRKRLS